MSEDNVELMREAEAALNRGDTKWLVDHAHEDVEFLPLRAATDGLLVHLKDYGEREAALAAAGMS